MDSGQMILVLEDDDNDVFFLKRAFAKMGLEESVQFVRDGAEAIEYLAGKGRFKNRANYPPPVVVVTDLKMPLVDGFEVLKWMRERPEYRDTPAFILSSSEFPSDQIKADAYGATRYFTKPRAPEQLLSLVDQMQHIWNKELAQLRHRAG